MVQNFEVQQSLYVKMVGRGRSKTEINFIFTQAVDIQYVPAISQEAVQRQQVQLAHQKG